ncbi:MAG: alpha/beta hydrolase [Lachnospiraceae bacterium]|nr:alpha/beta hydrolase [Lachnospiraceae bacterium]
MIINDYKINYIDEGSGEAVLLLHGWGSNLKSFTSLINLLKSKYRVLAIDYPGFGESEELKKSFSIDDYCDIVVEFLKKLEVKDVILVGHSYGGRIILKLNNRDKLPFEIKKNVLIDAAGLKDKKNLKVKLKVFTFKTLKNIFNILPISMAKKDEMIVNLRKKFGSSDYASAPKLLQETLVRSVNEDLIYCLDKMRESLIIWGDKDTVTPMWMAKLMESKIKNSGLVMLNGGHFSYIDDPVTFERVIISYFNL